MCCVDQVGVLNRSTEIPMMHHLNFWWVPVRLRCAISKVLNAPYLSSALSWGVMACLPQTERTRLHWTYLVGTFKLILEKVLRI